MTLRRQLLLVSLLTLVLPWAGCQFVRETESALRDGQLRMLSGAASAIADSLSQFPGEFLAHSGRGPNADRIDEQIYGHPLSRAPLIDGYFDDWPLNADSLQKIRGSDGTIGYVVGVTRQHVFVFADVRDKNVIYADPDATTTSADQVSLVSDSGGVSSRLRFSAEAPGKVQTRRITGSQTPSASVIENRIDAFWQDTATGYRLEARIPRNLIGSHLGIEIANAGDGTTVVSSSFTRREPGRFVTTSSLLSSAAAGHAQRQPGMRLVITNNVGWRLAQAGALAAEVSDNQYSIVPSGWQLVAYRMLLEQSNDAVLANPDPSGQERQHYVARALNGESTSRWFRNAETGRAVVAVAEPVWSGNVQTGVLVLQQDTEAILSLTNESLMRLITLTIVATAGVAAALLGYASWLSLRVRKLSHAADHALDDATLTAELPSANAADEIGDLSRSFSSVLRELATYNEYLRSLASKLSHELRTPLTIVTSSLENLDHEVLSDQSREYTTRARTGAQRLQKILNAMSEANRVEQLMENADTEKFDLRAAIEATTAAYQDAWPDRRFLFSVQEAEYRVLGSPELLMQMLDKLVDNAVDFSAVGDDISIGLTRDEESLVVSVTNPGPPLPKGMRYRLFESMVSVRTGTTGHNLGLGLYIAKLIAEGHGGSIRAENLESGVRFEVALPALIAVP